MAFSGHFCWKIWWMHALFHEIETAGATEEENVYDALF